MKVNVTRGARYSVSPHPTGKPFVEFTLSQGQPLSPAQTTDVAGVTTETGSQPNEKVFHPYSRGKFGVPEQVEYLGKK